MQSLFLPLPLPSYTPRLQLAPVFVGNPLTGGTAHEGWLQAGFQCSKADENEEVAQRLHVFRKLRVQRLRVRNSARYRQYP